MEILYIFPGKKFKMLNTFLSNSEVRIGYRLDKEIFGLAKKKRIEYIAEIALLRDPGISPSALKSRIGWWNSFFNKKLKFCIFPTADWRKFYLVELEPKVTYDQTSKDMMQVRKFNMIGEILNCKTNKNEPYKNKKGISRMKSE